jgi:DNA helicase-2/ATP-dependent DNA helicase PcrA
LVVYETPDVNDLLAELRRVYPAAAFGQRDGWDVPGVSEVGRISVWHWRGTLEGLVGEANQVLRNFAYPLVADGWEYVLSFPFSRQELLPRVMDPDGRLWLDVEDIWRLVTADAVETRFADIRGLPTRILQTPIEEALERALVEVGLSPQHQVKFDRYRLDFLVELGGHRVAVEADGHAYHDSERDRKRDEALLAQGLDRVFRFSGSAIIRDADGCAAEVEAYLKSAEAPRSPSRAPGPLDASQQVAVEHRAGPARVLAPAGSGKTRVLVHRIASLVEAGVDPSTILALAFNRKAYEQLVHRLEDLGIPTSPRKLFDPTSPGVVCASFNAFGFRYQRELLDLDLRTEPSSKTWRDLMSRALRDAGVPLRGTRRGSDPVGRFLEALERVRADLAVPDEEVVELEYFGPDRKEVVAFAPVLEHFERRRLDIRIQSFNDQLATAVVDLFGSPRRRQFVQSRFSHVLVDEYQDLNGAQLALVELISRPWRSLFVVGDDDQLIYGWRFAKLANILDFHERMPAEPYSSTYTLTTNYRSSRAIVESSRRVIDHNELRVPKDIRPGPESAAGEIRYVAGDAWVERAQAVVSFLQQYRQATRRWSDLAVLCRYKAQQPLIALALDRAEIPRSPLLAYRLFSDPDIRLLRSYIDLVREPRKLDANSFRLLLNRPNRYLSNELVERVLQTKCPWDQMRDLANQEVPVRGVVDLVDRVSSLRAKYREQAPSSHELVDDVILTFGLEEFWSDRVSSGPRRADDGDPLVLVELIRFHASEATAVSDFLELWSDRARQEESRFQMSEDTLAREQPTEEDHVVIGTMHSSKGREYEAVVLLDYDVELGGLTPAEIEEERRVFYVGLTRAQSAALVTIDGCRERPHRFIRETVRPAGPNERERLHSRLRDIRPEEEQAVVERQRAQAAVDAVYSGEEANELGARLAALRDEQTAGEQSLEELEAWLGEAGIRGVWRRVTRKRREVADHASSARAALEKTRAAIDEAQRRLLLLHGDPDVAASTAREEVEAAESELTRLRHEADVIRGRLLELDLLDVDREAKPGRMSVPDPTDHYRRFDGKA